MPITTGIDIVKVDRIKEIIEDKKDLFLNRVFSPEEISYCETKVNKYQHYAARFAAKEAFLKALHQTSPDIIYKDIIISKDGDVPRIQLCKAKERFMADISTSLSISHEKEFAVAVVVLEKRLEA
jgi:holo-[acyl-carrier protein] synthase